MNIENLSAEQYKELESQFKEKQKQELLQRTEREQSYKELSKKVVEDLFPMLESQSKKLCELKTSAVKELGAVIELKNELYNKTSEQKSHTFINSDGSKRITIGYHQNDAWDDTAGTGETMIKEAISSLATDNKSRALVEVVLKLLSKDKEGNLRANKVLELASLAEKIDNEAIKEGVRIISEAYRPVKTKTFIRAEYRETDMQSWKTLPLGLTEA